MQRTQTRRLVIAAASGIMALGMVLPASAATPATMDVTAGSLSISVPTNTVNLGTTVNSVDGSVITGALGEVRVEDARGAGAGSSWVATAISSAFTPPAGTAIAASHVGYTAGAITQVGTATYTANNPTNLTGAVAVVTASGITGLNSATWNPNIDIRVPGGAVVGQYVATITHSVA
ncbi:MAG TPA: hypothetical protein VM754_11200 [Actinomycetota bacterium]|nr:hypothetical protein [Actinomycetota bacterium]